MTGTLGSPAAARSSVTSRGDPRHFDVVLAHEPPAESAAGAHEVERHVLGRNAGAERRMLLGRNLARRPDLEPPVVEVRRGVLRLERRMRQQREEVLGFDGLRRGAECRLDVADHGAGRAAVRAHRPVPVPGPAAGSGRGRRLGRQFARLRQVPLAALRGDRAFVPDDLQRASRVVGEPPAVGHDRHARGEGVVALPRRLDDEGVLDARQLLDLVEVGADDLPPEDVALHQHRMEHVGERDVDAEDRTTRHDVQVVDAADPLADDLEVARVLERGLDGGGFRHGQARRPRRQRGVGRRALGRGVRDDTARRASTRSAGRSTAAPPLPA